MFLLYGSFVYLRRSQINLLVTNFYDILNATVPILIIKSHLFELANFAIYFKICAISFT